MGARGEPPPRWVNTPKPPCKPDCAKRCAGCHAGCAAWKMYEIRKAKTYREREVEYHGDSFNERRARKNARFRQAMQRGRIK